jgi:cysteine synthase
MATNIVKLSNKINPYDDYGIEIWVKCEFENQTGSIKDRIVKYILENEIKNNKIKEFDTIVAASSGNFGSGIALNCKKFNLKCIIFCPNSISKEKIDLMVCLGANIVLCNSANNYKKLAKDFALKNNLFDVNQYENKYNTEGHYNITGPEIWEQMNGDIDIFVSGAGSGGTICGIAKYFKEKNKSIKVYLSEPNNTIIQKSHKLYIENNSSYDDYKKLTCIKKWSIEGIGSETFPELMDFSLIDDIILGSDEDAYIMCHKLLNIEGLFVGGSAGLNVLNSLKICKKYADLKKTCKIITILPDTGFKSLSKIYNQQWINNNNYNINIEGKIIDFTNLNI